MTEGSSSTVRGTYAEDALLRDVVAGSPAIATLRERVRGVSEQAGYYERIRLGELVAGEVQRRREADTAHALERAVAARRRGSRGARPARPDAAFHFAFLVERERIDAFSGAVGDLMQELGDRVAVRYVGPLAPYSFADAELAAESRVMGLFTALLTLPLAPVRGTVWIAEKLQEQAELELYDESALQAAAARARGRARDRRIRRGGDRAGRGRADRATDGPRVAARGAWRSQ